MREADKQRVLTKWHSVRTTGYSPAMIADLLGLPRGEVRAVIAKQREKRRKECATYKITRQKKDGLRLVMVYCGGAEMRWWTDRDEEGIDRYVDALRTRTMEGLE